jgi:hypothetical protein
MKYLVVFDASYKRFEFELGSKQNVGIDEKVFSGPRELLQIIDTLSENDWFTLEHLRQLIDVTKQHKAWPIWGIS